MNKLTIDDVDLKGKRCFIRVDFNVPLDEYGNITDDTRIRSSLPTINYVIDRGGKVILASHLGRPNGTVSPNYSMSLLVKRLQRLLDKPVRVLDECIGEDVENAIAEMGEGDVVLLENLRFHKGEEDNDDEFARALARLTDVYVNDAFGTSHRKHASMFGIAKHVNKAVAGFLLKKEIEYFDRAVSNPMRPFVAILGGAKASSKIRVIKNLEDKVDKVIIGGGLCFTFMRALGNKIGSYNVENGLEKEAFEIMAKAKDKGIKFYLPVDFVVAERFDPRAETKVVPAQEVPDNWIALDIGPATTQLFSEVLHNVKTIIWNGPMGAFEMDAFSRGTFAMVHAVANSYALTIVGGGDTDVAVNRAGESEKISYISTGGGAFIQLLEGKSLCAYDVLNDKVII